MDTFITGYISGIISIIAIGIFIWTVRRGKGNSTESLEGRININNTRKRSSLDRSEELIKKARSENTGLGNIGSELRENNNAIIDRIEDSDTAVSRIIANAKRKGIENPEG